MHQKSESESLVHDISNRVQVLVGRSWILRNHLESSEPTKTVELAESICDDIDGLVEYIETLRAELKAKRANQDAA